MYWKRTLEFAFVFGDAPERKDATCSTVAGRRRPPILFPTRGNGASSEEEALARAIAESRELANSTAARLPPLVSSALPLDNLAEEYAAGFENFC